MRMRLNTSSREKIKTIQVKDKRLNYRPQKLSSQLNIDAVSDDINLPQKK